MADDDDKMAELGTLDRARVSEILAPLCPEERYLIAFLLGLDGQSSHSLEEAADHTGEDLETLRVRQASALRKLAKQGTPRRGA